MERNKNIDILRAIGILMIVVYHIYAVTGININIPIIEKLLKFGGEIGVTSFLILSGFSIYLSLDKTNGTIPYFKFIKNRAKRILPEYYFCLIISLFLMGGAVYLSKEHTFSILSHIFLVHNFSPISHGAINGVLWTLGVIFQFYLVAKLFYKAIKKHSIITLILAILITIGSRAIVFNLLTSLGKDEFILFIYERQLPTALDNFILGMFICHFSKNHKNTKIENLLCYIVGPLIFIVTLLFTNKMSIYSNNIIGYSWHTLLAISLSLLFIGFLSLKIGKSKIVNFFNFIAKYEYGIYLWHLIIMNNLIYNAPIIRSLVSEGRRISYIIIFILSVGISLLLSIIFNNSLNSIKLKASK